MLNYKDISIIVNEKKQQVIIANKRTGAWVKLSKECYDIIITAESENLTAAELIGSFEDNADAAYFKRLVAYMEKYMLIENTNHSYPEYPRDFNLSVTHRCNLNCSHCYISADSMKQEECLNTKKLMEIIDKILECDPDSITITGGEPLVRKDFFELTEYIRSRFKNKLQLLTNGTLITRQNVKSLCDLFDEIDISLDGVDEDTCAKVRGAGMFDLIISKVELLKEVGFKDISLSMIINKYTYDKSEQFNELNKRLGTEPMERKLVPLGRASENYDYLLGDMDEEALDFGGMLVSGSSSGYFANHCAAIKSDLHIDNDGAVYPCGGLALPEFKLGNICEIDSLKDFLAKQEYLSSAGYANYIKYMPTDASSCKDCSVNIFCIQCPLYVYSYKKLGLFDKFCGQGRAVYEKIYWGV